MMYIITKHEGGFEGSFTWHVNTPGPLKNVDTVVEVQADGDELLYVANQLVNVPFSKEKQVQNWFGDMAKFIAASLR